MHTHIYVLYFLFVYIEFLFVYIELLVERNANYFVCSLCTKIYYIFVTNSGTFGSSISRDFLLFVGQYEL